MSDVVDHLYALRDTAGQGADALRNAIADAQAILDRLDRIADDAEAAAELVDSSALCDREFGQAFVPERADMVRLSDPTKNQRPDS